MLRGIFKRILYSRLRKRISVGKTVGAGGFSALLVAAIVTYARSQGVDLPPEQVAELVDRALLLFEGSLSLLGVWAIRDAQDAHAEAKVAGA